VRLLREFPRPDRAVFGATASIRDRMFGAGTDPIASVTSRSREPDLSPLLVASHPARTRRERGVIDDIISFCLGEIRIASNSKCPPPPRDTSARDVPNPH
jgi:hypothetical protein